MTPLSSGYTAQVDAVDTNTWYEQVARFEDANLYQIWQSGSERDAFTTSSRFTLRKAGEIVAVAESRLMKVPLTRRGIAYVLWGPLCHWQRADPETFRQAVRAMRNEYVVARGLILRLNPRLFGEMNHDVVRVLSEEGFSALGHIKPKRSLIVDLSPPLDVLRRDLDKKWRNCLSKAERSELSLTSGVGLELFDQFAPVYDQMLDRKQIDSPADLQKHRRIQEELPEHLKMRVVIASQGGQPCAGAIYSDLGDTAVYLFGATNAAGMRTSASYLVQWEILKALKEHGTKYYDLNGIDPDSNPGTYHFKQGLAGKHGLDVTFPGQFQSASRSIANNSLLLIERLRRQVRAARARRAVGAAAEVR